MIATPAYSMNNALPTNMDSFNKPQYKKQGFFRSMSNASIFLYIWVCLLCSFILLFFTGIMERGYDDKADGGFTIIAIFSIVFVIYIIGCIMGIAPLEFSSSFLYLLIFIIFVAALFRATMVRNTREETPYLFSGVMIFLLAMSFYLTSIIKERSDEELKKDQALLDKAAVLAP